MRNDKVVLIFDKKFGENLRSLAAVSPVWIVNSPENDLVAQECWRAQDSNITTFKPQTFIDLLDTIDQHHHGWKQLEVIGEPLSDPAREVSAEYGASVVQTASGFLADR